MKLQILRPVSYTHLATGARVSELIQIKVEHIKLGHLALYSKGGKLRRIYIPNSLQEEALSWLAENHRESGFISVSYTHLICFEIDNISAILLLRKNFLNSCLTPFVRIGLCLLSASVQSF